MMISQCIIEKEQFKQIHVENDLRRIIALSCMAKSRVANPCQNKESREKKHDKRDKRNANEILFKTSLYSETWQTPLSPEYPILRKSTLTSIYLKWFVLSHALPIHHVIGVRRKRMN